MHGRSVRLNVHRVKVRARFAKARELRSGGGFPKGGAMRRLDVDGLECRAPSVVLSGRQGGEAVKSEVMIEPGACFRSAERAPVYDFLSLRPGERINPAWIIPSHQSRGGSQPPAATGRLVTRTIQLGIIPHWDYRRLAKMPVFG